MIIAGIIAEYNPLHEGHKYLIQRVREDLHADLVIAIMSGSFTERGIPAFFDKFSRTRAALAAGCDVVLELPVTVSTGSAEIFATGAIKALSAFGVTHLAFGSECGDISSLNSLSEILINESKEFSDIVKASMARGLTYPQAIKLAVDTFAPEYSSILDTPNNTLGLEYLKAIKLYAKDIIPFTIKREGAGYNDTHTSAGSYPSSTALRLSLSQNSANKFLVSDDFTEALNYKLLQTSDEELLKIADVNQDFINRLRSKLTPDASFSTLVESLKTRQLTYNKVSRALFHILLNITDEDYLAIKENAPAYLRVLGIRESAGKYLKALKEASSIPILTRLSLDERLIPDNKKEALSKDKASYNLYNQVYFYKYHETLENEYRGLIVITD